MLWQMIVIVVASNLDDLGVGFSLGIKKRVPWRVIWIISIISGITMAFGLILGEEIAFLLPGNLALYFASLIFACIGVWFFWQGVKNKVDDNLEQRNGQLGWKSALLLGLALGVDSFAAGFSGGLTGFPIIVTSVLAWLTSFIFILVGSHFARLISIRFIREHADYISGGIFVLLAIVMLLF
jgi:putative Mn2+ efflux pump MntP